MMRLLLKLIFFYFLLTVSVTSQTIKNIDIIGNKRISKESVIVFSDLKIGMD